MALTDIYERITERYHLLTEQMAAPGVVNDIAKYTAITREQAGLAEKTEIYTRYKRLLKEKEENELLLQTEKNQEMRGMIEVELGRLNSEILKLEAEMKALLIPKDPRDTRNVFMEIRAGTGGEESAIFAADLFRMYSRFAERKGWTCEVQDFNQTGIGGYKEIIFMVKGRNVYSKMKFESGIHRVQRVPVTEASGRIHTSAATVAVLPEVDETEVIIKPEDIRIDVFRASGAGGQHVNKTESAVRITHLPTGLVVSCQDEKSQHKNRERAMKVLRARLYELMEEKKQSEISKERREQVGSGDRSGKIRTYNFPQNRLTDHRVGLTLYKLEMVMEGDLDEIIQALADDDNHKKMDSAGV
jgi:peptide chain release factor 1